MVLLNIVGNSVWDRKYKRRINFRASANEICEEIRHGEKFIPLFPGYGNKVLVLPVINKNERTMLASQWKTLIELKFQHKGYTILKSDSVPTPKFSVAEIPIKKLALPKDIKMGESTEKLDVNISSIAATFGADWIVVSHLDAYKYKRKNSFVIQNESLLGKLEVYSRDGTLVISDEIEADSDTYNYTEPILVSQVWEEAEHLLESLGVNKSIDGQLKVAYMQLNIPRYW